MKRIGSGVWAFVLVYGLLHGCATVDPGCEEEINACLERCQASGGDEVKVEHVSPEQSTTWCEDRCQRCRGAITTPPPPAPSPPTYTGTAKP